MISLFVSEFFKGAKTFTSRERERERETKGEKKERKKERERNSSKSQNKSFLFEFLREQNVKHLIYYILLSISVQKGDSIKGLKLRRSSFTAPGAPQ